MTRETGSRAPLGRAVATGQLLLLRALMKLAVAVAERGLRRAFKSRGPVAATPKT
jgi:hypothetical protein